MLTEDGQFDRAPKRVPEPQKLQTFLDFLESVKLGLLFARWGPEIHLDHWVGWFANLVRDHPTKYPHLRELYVRSSWSLCMKMRDGTSFAIAHREVIDNTSVSEALARHLPPDSKGKGDKGGKGDRKGKSKQPPHDPSGPGLVHTSQVGARPTQDRAPPGPHSAGFSRQDTASSAPVASLLTAHSSRHTRFLLGLKRQLSRQPRDSSERPCRSGRHPARALSGTRPPLRLLAP